MTRSIFKAASRFLPSHTLVNGIANEIISPFYHLVSDNPPLHAKNLYRILSEKEFVRDLDFLLKIFNPIDSNTLLKHLNGEIVLEKPTLFLSFDDGFREINDVIAPILLRKGIPATFFVNPAYIGNNDLMYRCKISLIIDKIERTNISDSIFAGIAFLLRTENDINRIKFKILQLRQNQTDTIAKIAEMVGLNFNEYLSKNRPYLVLDDLTSLAKSGFTIGGHGYNHPFFKDILFNEQLSEVELCMKWIGSCIPNQPKLFAFPFTDFGVSDDLFKRILLDHNSLCDISFGTSGIQPVRYKRHLQRIPMEEKGVNGQQIVKSEILYYLTKRSIGYYRFYHG